MEIRFHFSIVMNDQGEVHMKCAGWTPHFSQDEVGKHIPRTTSMTEIVNRIAVAVEQSVRFQSGEGGGTPPPANPPPLDPEPVPVKALPDPPPVVTTARPPTSLLPRIRHLGGRLGVQEDVLDQAARDQGESRVLSVLAWMERKAMKERIASPVALFFACLARDGQA